MTLNSHNRALEADAREDTQSGELCFAGTRIPVRAVVSFAESGCAPEVIKREYPTLTIEQICAAFEFARVVTPPADEVGRAVERLKVWVGQPDRFEIQFASDLRLILSHVSRLEGDQAVLNAIATETYARLRSERDEYASGLKLAVEALEPFAKVAGLYDDSEDDDHEVWYDRSTSSLGVPAEAFLLQNYRVASAALRSISSLRHEDMPLAPGGDVEASRQSGGEG